MENDIHQSYSKHFNENYKFSKNLIEKLVSRTIISSFEENNSNNSNNSNYNNKINIKFPPPIIKENKKVIKIKNENEIISHNNSSNNYNNGNGIGILAIIPNNFLEPSTIMPNIIKNHIEEDENNDENIINDYEKKQEKNKSPKNIKNKGIPIPLPSSQQNQQQNEISISPSSPIFIGGQYLPEYPQLTSKVTKAKGFIDLSNQNFGNHRIVVFTESLTKSEKESEIHSISLKGNRLTDIGICEIVRQLHQSTHKNLMSIDLSSNKIGRSGAILLGNYLKELPCLQRLNLTNTGLGDGNTRLLFRSWNNPVQKIDVYQQNSLSIDDGDEESLEEDIFCDSTDNTPSLISLKLGNNKIEKFGAKELAKFLKIGGSNLAELDISWNELRSQGASSLWKALYDHPTLTALDLSWNSLGIWNSERTNNSTSNGTTTTTTNSNTNTNQQQAGVSSNPLERFNLSVFSTNSTNDKNSIKINTESSCAPFISKLLSTNNRLLHLNIAQNKFSPQECDIIGKGLQNNHTLLGIHITGNCCKVDNYGNLTSDTTLWPLESSHISEQIIKDTLLIKSKSTSNHSHYPINKGDLMYLRNSCWICESWQEVEFSYQLSERDMIKLNKLLDEGERAVGVHKLAREKEKLSKAFPVHMFASFDNWIPERMLLREKKQNDTIEPFVHQTLKRAQPASPLKKNPNQNLTLSPTKPTTPPPSHLRRLSTNKSENIEGLNQSPISQPNRVIRRRTSVQNDNINDSVTKMEESRQKAKIINESKPIESEKENNSFLLRSESYTYDSDEDVADDQLSKSDPKSRKLTFANTKYLLNSFESGHWSMMGGVNEFCDSDNENEDDLISTLLSHPTTGMKLSNKPGPGVFIASREQPNINTQRPVYSLRRMVPPGRHAYVFSVGSAPDNLEDHASFIVYDPSQPYNSTNSVLTSEKIKEANIIGVELPPMVNTLFIFDKNPFYKAKQKNLHIPEALTISNLLSYSRSPRPRSKNTAILQPLQSVWHESNSIFYPQYTARNKKHLFDCFMCDWSYGKTARVFSKSNDELSSIREVLMKYYSLLVDIFTYYSSVYSGDVAIGLGGMAYNEIILQCYVLEPVMDINSATLTKTEQFTEKQIIPLLPLVTNNEQIIIQQQQQQQQQTILPTNDQVLTPQTPSKPLSIDINPSNTSPSAPTSRMSTAPSVRATFLLKQINQQAATPQALVISRGLDAFSRFDGNDENLSLNNDGFTDSELNLQQYEIDSDMEEDTTDENIVSFNESSIVSNINNNFSEDTFEPIPLISSINNNSNNSGNNNNNNNINNLNQVKNNTRGVGAVGRVEVDMIFVSNCITGPKVRTNHKRTLTRFQFLDAVVSLSCLKYIQSGICFDVADAVEKFCVEILGQYATRERDELFLQILISKQIDSVIKLYLKDIEKIFKKHASGSDLIPLKNRLYSFSSWLYLIQQCNIKISERTLKIIFGQSKTQNNIDVLDELYDPKNLYFMEFTEAIVRCAFYQRKEALENGISDQGGLTPNRIADDVESIIKIMKVFASKKG